MDIYRLNVVRVDKGTGEQKTIIVELFANLAAYKRWINDRYGKNNLIETGNYGFRAGIPNVEDIIGKLELVNVLES